MRSVGTLLLLLLIAMPEYGQQVEPGIASQVADNFRKQSLRQLEKPPVYSKLNLSQTKKAAGDPSYYVFNAEENQGFVLVSASFSRHPILGFSHRGNFDPDHLPPALEELLDAYEKRSSGRMDQGLDEAPYKSVWDLYTGTSLKSASAEEEEIPVLGPLIRSRWDQGCYYNSLCPEDTLGECSHVRVGCVAVAMAQLMNYYEYPDRGRDSSSYTHEVYGPLSANFENTEYQWHLMPDRLIKENDPVAKLLSHCGIAIEMDYGPSVSWASTYWAAVAMIQYFRYSQSIQFNGYDSTLYSIQQWGDTIRQELDQFRPVSSSGPPPDEGERHAYVIDGYYGSEFLHYNWGWGGRSDGYFPVGGSFIVTGIQPEPCLEDTLKPNLVEDLSYIVGADRVEVSWQKPEMAPDGDYATQYRLIKDDTHDFITRDTLFSFLWDTLGTYQIRVQSLDDCLHPSDSFAKLEVILSDSLNYHPRLEAFKPTNRDTVPVYQGVYKYFEVEAFDPNDDELSYSWKMNGEEFKKEAGARIVHDFSGMEVGVYPLTVAVSDSALFVEGHWLIEVHPDSLAIIDDSDSIHLAGDWKEKTGPDAYGQSFHWSMRNIHWPSTAHYIYIPQLTGTYSLSVYVPSMSGLTRRASYVPFANDVPLDTFQLDQLEAMGNWAQVGLVDLQADSLMLLKIEDGEAQYTRNFLILDAVELNYLGLFDHKPPRIFLSDSLCRESSVKATSTEDALIYLVPHGTEKELAIIRYACIDSVEASAHKEIEINTDGLGNGEYWLYAIDSAVNISEPAVFTRMGVGTDQPADDTYLRIYPNPTKDILTIQTRATLPFTIEITSLSGQVLLSSRCNEFRHHMDLSCLPKGVYILRVKAENSLSTRRIIKL